MNIWNKIASNSTTFFIVILCSVNILVRLPMSNMPAYSDEIIYMSAVNMISEHNLNFFVNFWGYKPPLIYMFPALLTKFFHASRIWGRIEIYIFSSLALLYIYKLGKRIFPSSYIIYLPLLLALYPKFMVQSFIFNDSVPFTALFLAALYYFISNNLVAYVLSSSLLVMTKEPGVFLPITLIIFDLITKRKNHQNSTLSFIRYLYISIPLFLFSIWLLINKFTLGWFINPENAGLFGANIFYDWYFSINRTLYLDKLFIIDFLWIIFLIIIIGLAFIFISRNNRQHYTKKYLFLFIFLFIIYSVFNFCGPIQYRYFLFLYPLLFLVFFWVLYANTIHPVIAKVLMTILCIGFIYSNSINSQIIPTQGSDDTSFNYLKQIQFLLNTTKHINEKYSHDLLLSEGYEYSLLQDTFNGYVHFPSDIQYVECKDLTKTIELLQSDHKQTNSNHIYYIQDPFIKLCPTLYLYKKTESICINQEKFVTYCFNIYLIE